MRIELPNGQWAELRDPEEVTERQRRPIARATRGVRPEIAQRGREVAAMADHADGTPTDEKAVAQLQLQYAMTNDEADAYIAATDWATVALIEAWSFPHPITPDGLLDLPGRTLDRLRELVTPLVRRLFLEAPPDPNPGAPSGGSNGFATTSTAALPTTSPRSGAPSASSGSASA